MRCFYLNSFCLSLYKRRIFNSSQNNIKMSIYNSKLFIAQHGRMQATAFKKNNSRLFYAFTLFPYNLKLVQFWFAYQGINCNSINILFGCMQHLASLPMRQRRRDQMNSQNVIHSFFIICGVPIYIRWSSKKKLKYWVIIEREIMRIFPTLCRLRKYGTNKTKPPKKTKQLAVHIIRRREMNFV